MFGIIIFVIGLGLAGSPPLCLAVKEATLNCSYLQPTVLAGFGEMVFGGCLIVFGVLPNHKSLENQHEVSAP